MMSGDSASAAFKVVKFVSGNDRKIEEVQAILEGLGNLKGRVKVKSVHLELPEMQGSSADIVKAKVVEACRVIDGPVLVEDVSLCCHALGGMPGPYVKHFMACMPRGTLHRILSGFHDKSTTAVCTLGYSEGKGQTIHTFEGKVTGDLVLPRGEDTFGWDHMFQPSNSNKTFGEMSAEEKNKISHRALALKGWLDFENN